MRLRQGNDNLKAFDCQDDVFMSYLIRRRLTYIFLHNSTAAKQRKERDRERECVCLCVCCVLVCVSCVCVGACIFVCVLVCALECICILL